MDELIQVEIYEKSLLDTIVTYWPLSLVGLTAALVVFSEAYCLKKGGRYESAYAIVVLLLMAGMGSIYAVFITQSTVFISGERTPGAVGNFYPGDRFPVESWYYPSIVGLFLVLVALFYVGIVSDFRKSNYRVVILRLPVFLLISYLAFSAASVPYKVNSWLIDMEEEYLQDSRIGDEADAMR